MKTTLIPEKVKRIIPALGSPVDAEALAACRAVGRTLAAASLDYHDLAAAIPVAKDVAIHGEVSRRRENHNGAGRPRHFDTYAWRHAYTPRQEQEHQAQVRFCQSRRHLLTPWEREFIGNVAKLAGNLSIKQGDRLGLIADRLSREAHHA